jgi:hypothetical protein
MQSSTVGARRFFLAAQVTIMLFIVAETIFAWVAKLPQQGSSTSSLLFKMGDTAVTPFLWLTAIQAAAVWVALKAKPVALRAFAAICATIFAVTYTVFNSSTLLATTHQFTGWRWEALVVLDVIGVVLTFACIAAVLTWAAKAISHRPSGAASARV